MMVQSQSRPASPGKILILALLAIVIGGTIALSLPICRTQAISLIDLLFTAVSTVCVTGLQTVPLTAFTQTGHIVLLILIQIGGLGLMTFSFFIASLFLNLGMTSKLLAGQMFEFESWSKIKSFLTTIIGVTLSMELLGALALYQSFVVNMPPKQAAFYALFHAVSAFCNAGISLFERNMCTFSGDLYVLSVIGLLVFAGGIGFMVWYELGYALKNAYAWLRNRACPLFNFSLHTKLVLLTSLFLIILGALCVWSIEQHNTLKHLGAFGAWVNAFFISVSMRSAGFMVTDINTMGHATILVLLVLMIIGASPGSTGSGIKTTTFVLFCASVRAIIQNRDEVELYGRTIPQDQMQKVIGIVTIALSWIILATFALLVLEPTMPFLMVMVETISAFSTCGITMGATPLLCMMSKILLMATMIVGRIGMLTLVLSLRKRAPKYMYRYPEERVLLG
ncbi:MAG: Potassium uptake protein TrkH family [Candidatus Dependentiae bacterium]|nr:Potassium uptake protein TrkH family [Candidatus Dependentiae bacterium]